MERALVELARGGDEEAFASLIRMAGDRLMAIAFRILRDVDRAEDAVQQAIVTAWRDLPALRDPDRFGGWLYRVLVNACYVEARRTRRWTSTSSTLPVEHGQRSTDAFCPSRIATSWSGPSGACHRSSARSSSCTTTSGCATPRSPRRSRSRSARSSPASTTRRRPCERPSRPMPGRRRPPRQGSDWHERAWVRSDRRGFLADGPTVLPDRVFDAALDEVHLTRQRRVAPARAVEVPGHEYLREARGGGRRGHRRRPPWADLSPTGRDRGRWAPSASPSATSRRCGPRARRSTPTSWPDGAAPDRAVHVRDRHGSSICHPESWTTRLATAPWTRGTSTIASESGDRSTTRCPREVIWLAVASQPLGDPNAGGVGGRRLPDLAEDDPAWTCLTEPITIDGATGIIGVGQVALVTDGGRGYLVLLSRRPMIRGSSRCTTARGSSRSSPPCSSIRRARSTRHPDGPFASPVVGVVADHRLTRDVSGAATSGRQLTGPRGVVV